MVTVLLCMVALIVLTTQSCPDKCSCTLSGMIVNCSRRGLESVPTGISETVRKIDLSFNSINKLDDDLKDFPFLENLNMKGNGLQIINAQTFYKLPYLADIDLSQNKLSNLPFTLFKYQSSLFNLDISSNRLRILEDELFKPCTHLTSLNLTDNYLTNNVFYKIREIKSLNVLSLSGNHIRKLPYGMLSGSKIAYLWLNNAKLSSIHETAFNTMPYLANIYINNNDLTSLNPNTFKGMKLLMSVDLNKNKLICNCDLTKIIRDFKRREIEVINNSVQCMKANSKPIRFDVFDLIDFCIPIKNPEMITTSTTVASSITNSTIPCNKLQKKYVSIKNETEGGITITWNIDFDKKNPKLVIEFYSIDASVPIIASKVEAKQGYKFYKDLDEDTLYIALISIEKCTDVIRLKFKTGIYKEIAHSKRSEELIMNWTYIYIGSIIGALGLLLAVTCAVACYLLSKRKHQHSNKRRPMAIFTGSLDRQTRLSSGMNSLQRTSVCVLDQTDNLYESIIRTPSISSDKARLNRRPARYAVEYSQSPPGSDSYAPMMNTPANGTAEIVPIHNDTEYLQPSPGPVPAPRVPADYANSPLLEIGRHSMHQYEPDTKPTTFH